MYKYILHLHIVHTLARVGADITSSLYRDEDNYRALPTQAPTYTSMYSQPSENNYIHHESGVEAKTEGDGIIMCSASAVSFQLQSICIILALAVIY